MCNSLSKATSMHTHRIMRRELFESAAACFAMLAVAATASAQEAPNVGLLYNTSEAHSLTYRCDAPKAASISCDFVQVAVRPKATPADWANVVDEVRKEFRSNPKPATELCESTRELVAILEGRKPATKAEAMANLSPIAKNDTLRGLKALIHYCENPTESNAMAVARAGHDRELRTCLVSSNTWRQSFRLVPNSPPPEAWVADSKPQGVCGAVELSRFEADKSRSRTFTWWKYVSRKAITNPTGELMGVKCKDLDERSYTYDWKQPINQRSCDYIEFSPI